MPLDFSGPGSNFSRRGIDPPSKRHTLSGGALRMVSRSTRGCRARAELWGGARMEGARGKRSASERRAAACGHSPFAT